MHRATQLSFLPQPRLSWFRSGHDHLLCLLRREMPRSLGVCIIVLLCCLQWGCSSAYYNTLEKFGVHKRDVMVDRVADARDAQDAAKKQFQSALEQFMQVVEVKGGDLEKQYTRVDEQYKASKGKADDVRRKIASVESVSEALFDEWEKELGQYSSDALRRDSKRKMEETRRHYERLIDAMRKAESSIHPVLAVYKDQVLYLKHNLNAQAIAALQGELVHLEKDVAQLVREMEASIREADQFISRLEKP